MLIIPPALPHCVYALTRRDHVVVYIGVTSNLFARLGIHAKRSWWSEVAAIGYETFETRRAADQREANLIRTVNPLYNVVGSEAGTARHLEEMREAITAIRHGRGESTWNPATEQGSNQRPLKIIPEACAQEGVTLKEALPHLDAIKPTNISALQRASSRITFPPATGRRGTSKVYNLAELRAWRQGISPL